MSHKVGAGAILLSSRLDVNHLLRNQFCEAEQVLLVQRGFGASRFPGAWTIPTGVVEDGENLVEASCREAWEELGVCFDTNPTFLHSGYKSSFLVSYYIGDWRPLGDVPVLTKSNKGVVENIGLGFFPLSEAIRLGEIHDFVFATALRMYMQSLTQEKGDV
jgi:8-oxo-dGTP pyrophosphatase MutT (NUDIX family)